MAATIGKFEWHVTVDKKDRQLASQVANQFEATFSEITGCPILGQGTYCYVTGYSTDGRVAHDKMMDVVQQLKDLGVHVLRWKIEDIMFDSKTSTDRFNFLQKDFGDTVSTVLARNEAVKLRIGDFEQTCRVIELIPECGYTDIPTHEQLNFALKRGYQITLTSVGPPTRIKV